MPAEHRAGDFRLAEPGCTGQHDPAVAQHGDPLGHRDEFFEAVADQDDRRTLLGDSADQCVYPFEVITVESAGRLVQDHQSLAAGVVAQGPGDRHLGACSGAEGADRGARVEVDAQAFECSGGQLVAFATVDAAAAGGRESSYAHVLGDGERVEEAEVLVDDGDSGGVCLRPPHRQADRAAVEGEPRARVGGMDAGQDLDERRLARSVLPGQPVDLPGRDGEGDVAEHAYLAEGLVQTGEVQARGNGCRHDNPPQAPRNLS